MKLNRGGTFMLDDRDNCRERQRGPPILGAILGWTILGTSLHEYEGVHLVITERINLL